MRSIDDILKDPIVQAFNPEGKRFLAPHTLPEPLNPFASAIDVVALTLSGLPHIKAIPAFEMMVEDATAGRYDGKHTFVIDSSGNTGHGTARLAPAFGFENVKVVLAADVPESKKGLLAALSTVDLIVVGKGKSVAEVAKEEGHLPGHIRLNQYSHPGNPRAHERYTGPELARALDGNIGVVAIAMGSGGTVMGIGKFLKEHYPDAVVLGVRPVSGEGVPGARNKERMEAVVTLPWQQYVDDIVEVPRKESFIATRKLWRFVEPQPGPTSGLAYQGLMHYLEGLGPDRREALRKKKAAVICPDDGRFYSDVMIAELDPDQGI